MKDNPGRFDGKPVGAASRAFKLKNPFPGPKRFSKLRRKKFDGDTEAPERLAKHVLKWLRRGMSPENVGKRLGLPWREVYAIKRAAEPVDMAPRLVKR